MLALATSLWLALSPSMAGPPEVAAHGSAGVVDATVSLFLTGPAVGAQCTGNNITTDQGGAVTVSRASSAYCQNGSGSYTLIGSDKPVVEADGLRAEPASSNRVDYSEDLSGHWLTRVNTTEDTFSTDVSPTGSALNPFASSVNGGYIESNAFTISSTTATVSLWVMGGGQTVAFRLRDTTAGADRCTGTTAALSYATMAARPSVACSGLTSGNNHVLRLFPGGTGSTGTAWFWGVQVEPGASIKSSYIPTTGTAATRAGDGILFAATYSATAGCFGGTLKTPNPVSGMRLASNGSADVLAINASTQLFSGDGTNTIFSAAGPADITNRSVPFRVQWGGTALRVDLDSTTGTPGSFDGSMGTGSNFYLGSNVGVVQFLQGWMKNLKVSTSTAGCTP